MALIKELLGKTPEFGENVYLAETATIIGDVKMGKDCSVWFNAVIRGDVNSIRIAGAVVTQGTHINAGEIWAGVPAKKIKSVSVDLLEGEIHRISNNYVKYSSWYKEE
ncbi:hypothetical protein FQR65_LT16791 [Abscondita terminalis]|nr:hypothetical protein FQR65_LT16791 [Abscondita terminalis]